MMERWVILPINGNTYKWRVVRIRKVGVGNEQKTIKYFKTFEEAERFVEKVRK